MLNAIKFPTSVKAAKVLSPFFATLFWLFPPAGDVAAQPARITHVIQTIQKDNTEYLGRDLWFTMAQNYVDQGGKYYQLFVTSPNNTTFFVQIPGQSTSAYPISAGQIQTIDIPLSEEVTSSGVVEPKGIRVWSNTADLTAYLLSRNPSTSEGMYILPTIGWGTEYAVAAYASLFEGYGSVIYDYPSEFSIVANQNTTICSITPNVDLRWQNGAVGIHKAHETFTEILNQGECVQYQAVAAQDCYSYDVTGSIVKSNNPVGIVGGAQCSNVPCDKLSCDHLCEMIPPVRTWATSYHTIPFDTRIGGDSYLVIGSVDGQIIYRNLAPYCTLDKKYNYYLRPDVQEASFWTSNAPFLLVQYINSTDYETDYERDNGGITNFSGDPAMVVINAVEQYTPDIIFQTPSIQAKGGFSNYANVFVDSSVIPTTLFDKVPINSAKGGTRMNIPYSRYVGFRIAHLQPGKHVINSPLGVGAIVYGYGVSDSYAWAGSLGIKTFNDPDTIPPVAVPTGSCFDAHVTVTDNHVAPPASKISEIKVDSLDNIAYTPDPLYQIGVPATDTYYDMNVIDNTKPALLKIETHDYAGNRTIITSSYVPQLATVTPPVTNFGSGQVSVPTYQYITFTNTGTIPFGLDSIKLLLGNQGFNIDSGLGSLKPIPVGKKLVLKVSFTPPDSLLRSDTLELFDGCNSLHAIVIGTGGQPDFTVSNEDFQCQPIGSTTRMSDAIILNLSKLPITIDSITVGDSLHFAFSSILPPAPNKFPITIPANSQQKIEFSFMPDKKGAFIDTARFHSIGIGWKTAILRGSGCAPLARIDKDTMKVSDCGTAIPFLFSIKSVGNAEVKIVKVVVSGAPGFDTSHGIPYIDQAGNAITLPRTVAVGDQFFVNVIYTPPAQTSGIYSAKIYAITEDGDTTNIVTATVIDRYRRLDSAKGEAIIPAALFGSPARSDVLKYCNTAADTVTIQNVIAIVGPYNSSYTITAYTVNGAAKKLPIPLAQGDCLDITVQFDPSFSPNPIQTQLYTIVSDACIPAPTAMVQSGTTLGPLTISGVNILPTILSCETKDTTIPLTNPNVTNAPAMMIKNITVTGADSANFRTKYPVSKSVAGGKSVQIPITFAPNVSPGPVATNYSANIEVTLTNPIGTDTTLTAQISGSANGMSLVISSNFVFQQGSADGSTVLPLPINMLLAKNGLSDPIDKFGITKITLTYRYNTDLLDILMQGGLPKVSGLPSGWKVDPASNVNNAAHTLTLILDGSAPLTDAQVTTGLLGTLNFEPRLTKGGTKATSVVLAPPVFETGNGGSVGNCLLVTQTGTEFTLVYECGDSTLETFINGGKIFRAFPASPNPAGSSGRGILNFTYVSRIQGVLSLVIYDELGKEVARVIDKENTPAGTYQIGYDVSRLNEGTYVYRFTLNNKNATSGRVVIQK